jgi:hypothetical protein
MNRTAIKACRDCAHYVADSDLPCCSKYPVHHVDYLNGEEHFAPRLCHCTREAHGLCGPSAVGFEPASMEELKVRLQRKNWFVRILDQL